MNIALEIIRIIMSGSLMSPGAHKAFPEIEQPYINIRKVLKESDPKEMTVEEIEKKLGYPIKIVK